MNREVEEFLSSHAYAETTERTYSGILSRLIKEWPDSAVMSASNLLMFIRKKEWNNSRQCVALAASKKYLAWRYGESHSALSAKIKRVVGKPQRALVPEMALKLLASFNAYTPKGARDLALCALALDTGLRASELCRLRLADTDTEQRVLQVIVKGGQWKAAVFSEETAAHIERWKVFREKIGGRTTLFVHSQTGKGLTPEGLYNIIEAWGIQIGIKLSPHDLRRSFATLATLNGAPERVLMEGGRWSNSEMIHRYTRTLKLEAMREYLPVARLGKA